MTVSTAILDSIVEPANGGLSPELARYVLSLSFPKKILDHCLRLSQKAQMGTLSRREQAVLEEYLSANAFLSVLKSKARISLRSANSAE